MTSIGLTPLRNASSSSLATPRAGRPSNTWRATGSSLSSADLISSPCGPEVLDGTVAAKPSPIDPTTANTSSTDVTSNAGDIS